MMTQMSHNPMVRSRVIVRRYKLGYLVQTAPVQKRLNTCGYSADGSISQRINPSRRNRPPSPFTSSSPPCCSPMHALLLKLLRMRRTAAAHVCLGSRRNQRSLVVTLSPPLLPTTAQTSCSACPCCGSSSSSRVDQRMLHAKGHSIFAEAGK